MAGLGGNLRLMVLSCFTLCITHPIRKIVHQLYALKDIISVFEKSFESVVGIWYHRHTRIHKNIQKKSFKPS